MDDAYSAGCDILGAGPPPKTPAPGKPKDSARAKASAAKLKSSAAKAGVVAQKLASKPKLAKHGRALASAAKKHTVRATKLSAAADKKSLVKKGATKIHGSVPITRQMVRAMAASAPAPSSSPTGAALLAARSGATSAPSTAASAGPSGAALLAARSGDTNTAVVPLATNAKYAPASTDTVGPKDFLNAMAAATARNLAAAGAPAGTANVAQAMADATPPDTTVADDGTTAASAEMSAADLDAMSNLSDALSTITDLLPKLNAGANQAATTALHGDVSDFVAGVLGDIVGDNLSLAAQGQSIIDRASVLFSAQDAAAGAQ